MESENLGKTIRLKKAGKEDYRFLYNLLKERDSIANISHRKMPTYEEHVNFVKSKPYSNWYIIEFKTRKAGSVYLSKTNEIGIFLKNDMHGKGIGKEALQIIMKKNPRKRYLANINPRNKKSIKFFKKNNFMLIQHTYELNYEE